MKNSTRRFHITSIILDLTLSFRDEDIDLDSLPPGELGVEISEKRVHEFGNDVYAALSDVLYSMYGHCIAAFSYEEARPSDGFDYDVMITAA